MKGILVTAPHAFCYEEYDSINNDKHSCDYASLSSAEKIYDLLELKNKYLIKSTMPRKNCDMNRIQCRNTSFRNQIREKYILVNYLIDVHSFPRLPEYPLFMKEVYIIDDSNSHTKLSKNLNRYLINQGFDCTLVKGNGVNDITDESRKHGIQSVLIEISEGISDKRKDHLCAAIAYFFNSME